MDVDCYVSMYMKYSHIRHDTLMFQVCAWKANIMETALWSIKFPASLGHFAVMGIMLGSHSLHMYEISCNNSRYFVKLHGRMDNKVLIFPWNLFSQYSSACYLRLQRIFYFHPPCVRSSVCQQHYGKLFRIDGKCHYNDAIMSAMASQITSLTIVY